MVLDVVFGTSNGLQGERTYHQQQVTAVQYLRAYRIAPDYALTIHVDPWRTASWIRRNASIAESLHLSTFSTPPPRGFESAQSIPSTTVVLRPLSNTTVHGTVVLDPVPIGVSG